MASHCDVIINRILANAISAPYQFYGKWLFWQVMNECVCGWIAAGVGAG
ncbi:hypothetical protein NT01EI_1931 [Edwardsiella ictaluri 93-146]|uniref:Uncharacterized protein n=1 Tax=Edwardsiella ictaluri (strain 93-146) TaxID=634503 RepID=C5B891_EDWI9|nr:hypothetical protein NT01EI_1931 [Edwardsiella ictaluri 93-146]